MKLIKKEEAIFFVSLEIMSDIQLEFKDLFIEAILHFKLAPNSLMITASRILQRTNTGWLCRDGGSFLRIGNFGFLLK